MVALVATGGKSTRVIEQRGWNDRDAVRAADTCPEGIEVLPVGRYRDEMWQIVARPKTAIDPYCTFAAIRKLLATARVPRSVPARREAARGAVAGRRARRRSREHLGLRADGRDRWSSPGASRRTPTVRPHHRRNRHRQGDGRPRHPPRLRPRRQAVPAVQLHRGAARHAREPAVRPPQGRVHRRRHRLRRRHPRRRRRHALPRRDRRDRPRAAAEAAALPRDPRDSIRSASRTRSTSTSASSPRPTPTLEQLVADGRFREDLFYRLNVRAPASSRRCANGAKRSRRSSTTTCGATATNSARARLTIGDETLEYLLLFSWPGNVRQLANEVRRMVALAEPDSTLTPALLSPEIQASRRTIPPPRRAARSAGRARSAAAGRRGHCSNR